MPAIVSVTRAVPCGLGTFARECAWAIAPTAFSIVPTFLPWCARCVTYNASASEGRQSGESHARAPRCEAEPRSAVGSVRGWGLGARRERVSVRSRLARATEAMGAAGKRSGGFVLMRATTPARGFRFHAFSEARKLSTPCSTRSITSRRCARWRKGRP